MEIEGRGIEGHDASGVNDERIGGEVEEVLDQGVGVEGCGFVGGEIGLDDAEIIGAPPGLI